MVKQLGLPGELTLHTVAARCAEFRTWLDKLPTGAKAGLLDGRPLRVDASKVREVDAAGLQLLLALSASLTRRRRPLKLIAPSQALAGAAAALGIAPLLLP